MTDLGEDDGHPFRRLVRLRLIWLLAGTVVAITVAILALIVTLDGDDGSPAGSDSVQNGGGSSDGSSATAPPSATPLAAEPTQSAVDADELREPPPGFAAASPGGVDLLCASETELAALFHWAPSEPGGTEQRVEVDFSAQKFATPPFFSSQELAATVSSLAWNIPPGFAFSWRVITRLNGDWVAGEPANVFTAPCPPLDYAQ